MLTTPTCPRALRKNLLLPLLLLLLIDVAAFAQEVTDEPIGPTFVQMGLVVKLITLAALDFYAVVFLIGLIIRFEWFQGVPSFLNPLADSGMLTLFGLLYVAEFFIEKIPGAGAIWHGFNAFFKPIAIFVFILSVVFNKNFEIGFFTVVLGLGALLLFGILSAKLHILSSVIPGVSVITSLIIDIVIIFLTVKLLIPEVTASIFIPTPRPDLAPFYSNQSFFLSVPLT